MKARSHIKALLLGAALAAVSTRPPLPPVRAMPLPRRRCCRRREPMAALLDYLRNQNTTGFLVIQDGRDPDREEFPGARGRQAVPALRLWQVETTARCSRMSPPSRRASSRC